MRRLARCEFNTWVWQLQWWKLGLRMCDVKQIIEEWIELKEDVNSVEGFHVAICYSETTAPIYQGGGWVNP